ncbi:MAG TPA: hypothetical protein VIA06_05645 [Candidatus Dormibacteraeota bacterium]|jgi:glutamate formiminotransferase|nr:hypothetical protein [Candidatus Dormibacteraeota bacterium]
MSGVFESVPNFSEGVDADFLRRAGDGEDVLDLHADAAHNRSVVTLCAEDPDRLLTSLLELIAMAHERIDLRRHRGLHPRVGVADVVPVVALGGAGEERAAALARRVGEEIWGRLGIPVCWYGSLAEGRRLADIRRRPLPDLGTEAHATAGICCVGSRPPLVAYNLVFDLPRPDVSAAAAELRRLPGVRTLTFPLADGRVQLSMNLTSPARAGAAVVFAAAAESLGVEPEAELVGLCPAAAAGPGCDGGLLEGRLGAAAARRAAGRAERRGDAEAVLLAGRLRTAAGRLADLPADQGSLLDGAEIAVGLRRVLEAADLGGGGVLAMLQVAAEELDAALVESTRKRHPERSRLLRHWLVQTA